MADRKYTEPFLGGRSAYDMRAGSAGGEMQPTPPQPHLAHCCECNSHELAAAKTRQETDLDHTRKVNVVEIAMQVLDLDAGKASRSVVDAAEKVILSFLGEPVLRMPKL